jgi:hypothetical protein
MAVTVQRQCASAVTERSQDACVGSASANGTTILLCDLRTHAWQSALGTTAKLGWRKAPSAGEMQARSTCHNPTTPLSLALYLSALTMREIRLVMAPLDPGHAGEALLHRLRMQGEHDGASPAELRHRPRWRLWSPNAPCSAPGNRAPTS